MYAQIYLLAAYDSRRFTERLCTHARTHRRARAGAQSRIMINTSMRERFMKMIGIIHRALLGQARYRSITALSDATTSAVFFL